MGEGRSWVVITALAPLDEQTHNYLLHFADAGGYDPKRDVPSYLAARIQRRTVSDTDAAENDDWDPVPNWSVFVNLEKKEADSWAARAPERVNPDFFDPALAKPLGPLAFRNWGHWATHPEIPLAQPKARKGRPPARGPRGGNPTPGLIDPNVPGGGNTNVQSPQQEQQPEPTTVDNGPPTARSAGIRLVRIFDYNVEAGKIYRYRIQLALKNPNVGIDPRFLENPAQMQDGEYRESVWSEPSNIVRVPADEQVYVVTNGNKEGPEDNIIAREIIVREIDFDKGEQRTGRLSLQRGEIASQKTDDKQLLQGKGSPAINNNSPISTDLVLLDWHGGESLGGFGGPPDGDQDRPAPEQTVMTAPAEMLFLDSRGNLFARNSLSDAAVTGAFNKQWELRMDQDEQRAEKKQDEQGDETEEELIGKQGKKKKGKKKAQKKRN